jgi:integrase
MRWSEINLDTKIWTVPAARIRADREHRVPLASRAVAILRQLEKINMGEFMLPGQARNKPLSNMAMEMMLRRMKIEDAAVHGFRSSFGNWAGNVSSASRGVVETALAHVIGDKQVHPREIFHRAPASLSKIQGWWRALDFLSFPQLQFG